MDFRVSELSTAESYKMLVSVVVPRPIAFVSSLSGDGVVNAAPFSFFNMLGSDPPILGIGIAPRSPGEDKDTLANIEATGDFVVHLVEEGLLRQMNVCAIDFPTGVSEITEAGLTTRPATIVKTPVIKEASVSIECFVEQIVKIGNNNIVLGRIVAFGIEDDFLLPERYHVDTPNLKLVGRMHGRGWYAKTTDLTNLERIRYEDWVKETADRP